MEEMTSRGSLPDRTRRADDATLPGAALKTRNEGTEKQTTK